MVKQSAKRGGRILLVLLAVGAITTFYRATAFANSTTVALSFLLVVLAAASRWGLLEAILGSIVATFCFNYFFLPPVGKLTIADPQNWIALFTFLAVSIVASQLAERARRTAQESARARELAARAEAVRQREAFKSTLLDALAHELKTPLTALKTSVSALLSNPAGLSPARQELISIIAEETEGLHRLISEILQMARSEAGKLRLKREAFSPEGIVRRALEDLSHLLNGREVQVEIEPGLPPVEADTELLRTVVKQLLDNAAKYSVRGTPLCISAKRQGRDLLISVTDRGPGLGEEELSLVFEKYVRGSTAGDSVPGTGLGLAIARDIVMAHGGRIWAESVLGQGTRVSFTLPAAPEKAKA